MVEALTIVLAVGVTRGWRSAIIGTIAALSGLAVVVAALGPALAAGRADRDGMDWYAFTVSFKGVFLEGLEVAFIVITVGGAQHNVALAAVGAAVALVVVLAVGVVVHRPLSRVPENTMKFGVGVMLTTFGIF